MKTKAVRIAKSLVSMTLVGVLVGNARAIEDPSDGEILCEGPTCLANYIVFPNDGWEISSDGQSGQGQYLCDPCKHCSAIVTWTYSGFDPFRVADEGDQSQTHGNTGTIITRTDCDGLPNSHTFSTLNAEAGLVTADGQLLCPCQGV